MNFLAHSILTPTTDHWMLGNLVADLIKKKEYYLLSDDIQRGVKLHYKIDDYTDRHSLVAEANQLLYETQGKYSPVATDLIWDLCLSEQWSNFTDLELANHVSIVYQYLLDNLDLFETKLEGKVKFLIDKDFLNQYTSVDKMQFICEKIHQKTKFASNLDKLMVDYIKHKDEFNAIFNQYFPLLRNQVEGWKNEINLTFQHS